MSKQVVSLNRVVIRFAGDSGDGMQLTGDRFTSETAGLGNDLSTLTELTHAEVQQLLGHSSVSLTTGIYGHLTVKTGTRGPAPVERELA